MSDYERWKNSIQKHTPAERHAPMLIVLNKMRRLYAVEDKVHSALRDWKVYEEAVRVIAHEDLKPVFDDVLENVQRYLTEVKGEKGSSKDVYLPALDMYSSLLAIASQEVMVNSYDPNNWGPTLLGIGSHLTTDEARAHVEQAKRFADYFNIALSPSQLETLRNGRNMFFWNLLVHPNVMNNDSLQGAILFYKAQIEMPLLEEQISMGIYDSVDMWRTIQDGYHKKAFAPKGQQADNKGGINISTALEGAKAEKRKTRSMEEFIQKGEEQGWYPGDDFFNDNFEYMIDAFRGIKQAQLLAELKKMGMKGAIEYEPGSAIDKINKQYPSPFTFRWIEFESSPNIVAEAERLTKLFQKDNPGAKVEVQRVLQEGGWIGSQAEGLTEWYRGVFEHPHIYRTLYDMISTYLQSNKGTIDELGFIATSLQHIKIIFTFIPFSAVRYLGLVVLNRAAWKVIPYIVGIVPRVIYYGGKGLVKGTANLIRGKSDESMPAVTEYEKGMARMLTEAGMTTVSGYRSFLINHVDKMDKGIFKERQSRGADIADWVWTIGGSCETIMTEMIGRDTLRVAIKMVEQNCVLGMSLEWAAKRTAAYMNGAS